MADELTQEGAAQGAPATPVDTAEKASKPAKASAKGWPKYLKCTGKHGLHDPDTNIRFSPVNPVRVDAPPKHDSWLDVQIKAGLIAEA